MLANVFTKTTLDRWKPPLIASVSLAVTLVFGMAVYRGIDVSFWDDLPEAFRSMFGIPYGADVGGHCGPPLGARHLLGAAGWVLNFLVVRSVVAGRAEFLGPRAMGRAGLVPPDGRCAGLIL